MATHSSSELIKAYKSRYPTGLPARALQALYYALSASNSKLLPHGITEGYDVNAIHSRYTIWCSGEYSFAKLFGNDYLNDRYVTKFRGGFIYEE
jgi:hypothetical protein